MGTPDPVSPVEEFDVADRQVVARVAKLYEVVHERKADPDGLRFYVTELKRGTPLVAIVRTFLTSDEYLQRSGASTWLNASVRTAACHARADGLPNTELDHVSSGIADMIEGDPRVDSAPLLASLSAGCKAVDQSAAYRWWIDDFERPILPDDRKARVHRLRIKPTFTFIMSLDDSDADTLSKAISAIRNQVYAGVELVLVSRRKLRGSMRMFVDPLVRLDRRVKLLSPTRGRLLQYLPHWTDAEAVSSALQAVTGDFLAIIKSDNQVSTVATLEFAEVINKIPDCEVIYADSDFIDGRGQRHSPEFRPAWDPDRLFAGYDLGPLVMYSAASVRGLRRWQPASLQSVDFDLCLQVTLAVGRSKIQHIPRVLCHQGDRTRGNPKHSGSREEPTKVKAAIVRAALAERNARVICERIGPDSIQYRAVFCVPQPPPLVSILIPTRDRVDLLRTCIDSLLRKTRYSAVQVVLIDNNSRDDCTWRYYRSLTQDARFKFVSNPGEFNWGKMNNLGVKASSGEILVLLNNDVEVIEQDWLDELVGQVLRPEIGIVGTRLLYPDGTLQHGGMVTTPRGAGLHVMRFASPSYAGYMNQLRIVHEVSAVTGACLAVRKEVYRKVGGIEEEELRVGCGDVDFCLRVRLNGYRVLWTPYATLVHRELSTRGPDDTPEKAERARREESFIARKWAAHLREDPHWSKNLALEEDVPPLLAVPPRWTAPE